MIPGRISVTAKWGTAANDENPVLVVCGPFKLESGITWKSCGVNLSDADFNNYTFKATVEETFLTLVGDGKDINPGAFLQYMGLDNVRVECMAPLGIHRFCNGGSF